MTDDPAPKLTPRQKRVLQDAHLVTVAERYLAGQAQATIAAEIGVTQSTVSRYLKKLQERWREAANEFIDDRKARELARIDRVEREYWEAWEKSKTDARTRSGRKKTVELTGLDEDKNLVHVPALEREYSLSVKAQTGDPRYLQGVQWCVETRLKIMGGFAPVKVDVTWQKVLEEHGLNPSDAFEQLVAAAAAQLAPTDGSGGSGGSEPPPQSSSS